MDLVMNYDLLRNMYLALGDKDFFKVFQKTYSKFNLYTMSTAWVDSKEYILKFKGGHGDVLITWK